MHKEYIMIKAYYGTRTANRSRVPLMNHIDEGLLILDKIGSNDDAKRAFCIHPLVQADDDLSKNWVHIAAIVDPAVLLLAMEYRNIANQYLSHRVISSIEQISLSPLKQVNDMLMADKIQNYKDFIVYHRGRHSRSDNLETYFNNWLRRLDVCNFEHWFSYLSGYSLSDIA